MKFAFIVRLPWETIKLGKTVNDNFTQGKGTMALHFPDIYPQKERGNATKI